MAKLFTREQARTWLRENNLKDGNSIENAFIAEIKDVLQEALEEEMNTTLGYNQVMIGKTRTQIIRGMAMRAPVLHCDRYAESVQFILLYSAYCYDWVCRRNVLLFQVASAIPAPAK